MTDIPEDVMKLARETALEIAAGVFGNGDARYVVEHGYKDIARALIADRAAQAERMARMEEALKPFAAEFSRVKKNYEGFESLFSDEVIYVGGKLSLGHLHEAARSLSQEGSEPS